MRRRIRDRGPSRSPNASSSIRSSWTITAPTTRRASRTWSANSALLLVVASLLLRLDLQRETGLVELHADRVDLRRQHTQSLTGFLVLGGQRAQFTLEKLSRVLDFGLSDGGF